MPQSNAKLCLRWYVEEQYLAFCFVLKKKWTLSSMVVCLHLRAGSKDKKLSHVKKTRFPTLSLKKWSKTKKRRKEEKIGRGNFGAPTRKVWKTLPGLEKKGVVVQSQVLGSPWQCEWSETENLHWFWESEPLRRIRRLLRKCNWMVTF